MITAKKTPLTNSILFGCAAIIVFLLHLIEVLGSRVGFLLMTGILLGYLLAQITTLRASHGDRWLINPVVLCSGLAFFLAFGLANLLFFLSPDTLDPLGLVPDVTPGMFKMMALVVLACVAMWQGYWSIPAAHLSSPHRQQQFAGLLRKSNRLRPLAVPLLVMVSVSTRLAQVKLGIFGYSTTYDDLVAAGGYSQYLALLSSLGKVALVAASLNYYVTRRMKSQLILVLCIEVAFGVLSGFKSQIALPFVVVGLCQYLATGRVPKLWIVGVIAGILVAYQVVEPFRALRNDQVNFRGNSVAEIAAVIVGAQSADVRPAGKDSAQFASLLAFLARSSMVYVGSIGVDYKDASYSLPEGSPEFLTNIFLAPAYAWIPRAIWKSKPLGDLGLWYTQEVIGHPGSLSNTAMSPVTYLYFAGGPIAIFLGFYLVGLLQRAFFALTRPATYIGGAIVFLGELQVLVMPPDGLNDLIIALLREIPLLLLVQAMLILPMPKRANWAWRHTMPSPPLTRKP